MNWYIPEGGMEAGKLMTIQWPRGNGKSMLGLYHYIEHLKRYAQENNCVVCTASQIDACLPKELFEV